MATEAALALTHATLGVSAAIAVVLPARTLVRRLFGVRAAYALWAMVPAVIAATLLPHASPALRIEIGAMRSIAGRSDWAASASAWTDVLPALLAVYAAGAALAFAWLAAGQIRFLRRLGPLTHRGGGVWRSARTDAGPCLVGVWRPRIVVPIDFEARYEAAERDLILAHEREHRRQGDAFHNALSAALIGLQWFNPLVHVAAGRYRRDQELACDARVMRRFPGARRRYAEAMLKTQHTDATLPLGCTWQSRHPLRERIAMLHHALPGRLRRRLGLCTVAALILSTAGTAWALQSAASEPTYARLTAPDYPTAPDGTTPEGTVYLKIRVGSDGIPLRIEPERVAPANLPASVERMLVESAIAAARTWTFNPAQRDGRAVEGDALVPIRYSASDAPPLRDTPEAGGALDEITVRHP